MGNTAEALIILIPVLLVSMSVHELMHAVTSDWLGDSTARHMGRITLNPLKHIDPFFTVALPMLLILSGIPPFAAAKPVQVNFHQLRYGEFGGAIVGMVGPITNLLIAVLAALIFNVVDPTIGTTTYNVFLITILLNIGLFVFNSIPWPPLDGSRLLYAFAPRGLQQIMERIESFGIIGLVAFILIFYQLGVHLTNIIVSIAQFLAPTLVV